MSILGKRKKKRRMTRRIARTLERCISYDLVRYFYEQVREKIARDLLQWIKEQYGVEVEE